jgi:hypothetical protein
LSFTGVLLFAIFFQGEFKGDFNIKFFLGEKVVFLLTADFVIGDSERS